MRVENSRWRLHLQWPLEIKSHVIAISTHTRTRTMWLLLCVSLWNVVGYLPGLPFILGVALGESWIHEFLCLRICVHAIPELEKCKHTCTWALPLSRSLSSHHQPILLLSSVIRKVRRKLKIWKTLSVVLQTSQSILNCGMYWFPGATQAKSTWESNKLLSVLMSVLNL